MRRTLLTILAVLILTSAVNACCGQRKHRRKGHRPAACSPVECYRPCPPAVYYPTGQHAVGVVATPAGPVATSATPADSPATFLSLLNAERARYGRHPLAWDDTYAAYAARNTGIHAPWSRAPGTGQCWASTPSYNLSYSLWMGSPAHRSILMNAYQAVGCSNCPTGTTANAR